VNAPIRAEKNAQRAKDGTDSGHLKIISFTEHCADLLLPTKVLRAFLNASIASLNRRRRRTMCMCPVAGASDERESAAAKKLNIVAA
jgi:predicted dinucleotide-binding enzyme